MKGTERMVCHFYRENWPCKVTCNGSGCPASKRCYVHSPWTLLAHYLAAAFTFYAADYLAGVRHGHCCAVKPPVDADTIAVRLQVMDKHLSVLAQQHTETKFVKVSSSQEAFCNKLLLPSCPGSSSGAPCCRSTQKRAPT